MTRYEKGDRNPKDERVMKLACLFNNIIKKDFQEENGLYFKKFKIKGNLYNINYVEIRHQF